MSMTVDEMRREGYCEECEEYPCIPEKKDEDGPGYCPEASEFFRLVHVVEELEKC